MVCFGLKLGSINLQYAEEIQRLYDANLFQYIELFVHPGSYVETVNYWKKMPYSYVIHAPHSAAGMNLSDSSARTTNKDKLVEAFRYADTLGASHIIIHSGVNGHWSECVSQLWPFTDSRVLIENKPVLGLNGEHCVGFCRDDLSSIINELHAGFCLDFGHAICAANTLKHDPLLFINDLMMLKPTMFHLTDGDYSSGLDSHEHYGKGSFPLNRLLDFIPDGSWVTNEAKKESNIMLNDYESDIYYIRNI